MRKCACDLSTDIPESFEDILELVDTMKFTRDEKIGEYKKFSISIRYSSVNKSMLKYVRAISAKTCQDDTLDLTG